MAVDDLKSKSAEMMKKILTVGVGTVFLTEEALRGMASEWKLPKEVIAAILESSRKTKNEFLQTLSQDVFTKIADKVDPIAFMEEFITRNEIEFTVKVGIKPRAGVPTRRERKRDERERDEDEGGHLNDEGDE